MNDDMQNPVPTPSQEARQWAMFCHFAAFLGLVFPFGNLLGPLIIWQIKKDLDPVVDAQGNFSIDGIPPGKYKINAWHGTLGIQKGKVEIAADGTASIDFTFK